MQVVGDCTLEDEFRLEVRKLKIIILMKNSWISLSINLMKILSFTVILSFKTCPAIGRHLIHLKTAKILVYYVNIIHA